TVMGRPWRRAQVGSRMAATPNSAAVPTSTTTTASPVSISVVQPGLPSSQRSGLWSPPHVLSDLSIQLTPHHAAPATSRSAASRRIIRVPLRVEATARKYEQRAPDLALGPPSALSLASPQ